MKLGPGHRLHLYPPLRIDAAFNASENIPDIVDCNSRRVKENAWKG